MEDCSDSLVKAPVDSLFQAKAISRNSISKGPAEAVAHLQGRAEDRVLQASISDS